MTIDSTSYTGHQALTSSGSDHNVERLHIDQAMDERRHAVPVKIIAVHGGSVGPAPTADVQPLVDQVDGLGNRTSHAPVYGVPVSRVHSGNGAIISDPVAGDTMLMSIADRDISTLKNTGQQSAPGSKRRGSMSDGIVHHAMLSVTPKQYVQFRSDGVTVMDVNGHQIITTKNSIAVVPKEGSGAMVLLGGDGSKGTFDFVSTPSGPSINVKARIS